MPRGVRSLTGRGYALVLAGVVGAAAAGTLGDLHVGALRVAVGLTLVLLFPGLSLVEASCPRLELSTEERALASIGLSLGLDICAGLLLNLAPGGLTSRSVYLSLGGLTVLLAVAGMLQLDRAGRLLAREAKVTRRIALKPRVIATIPRPGPEARRWMRRWGTPLLVAVFALLVAAGAIAASVVSAEQPTGVGYAAISAMYVRGHALRVEVQSHENVAKDFSIAVTDSTGARLGVWQGVRLRPGQVWERDVSLAGLSRLSTLTTELFVGSSRRPVDRLALSLVTQVAKPISP